MALWAIPRDERATVAYILGGGRSLPVDMVPRLQGRGFVIAVNNAYQIAPFAQMIYWADRPWFEEHHMRLVDHPAEFKVTRCEPHIRHNVKNVRLVEWDKDAWLSTRTSYVAGMDSGTNALNIAYLLGARQIVLLGFDMSPVGHWHEGHSKKSAPPPDDIYRTRYVPVLNVMANKLKQDGVEVVNASPGSYLQCFPIAHLSDLL